MDAHYIDNLMPDIQQYFLHNVINYKGVTIQTWSDYIKQNKGCNPIRDHLSRLSYSSHRAINNRNDCIHQCCSSTESCVERLIKMCLHPLYAISIMSLGKELFVIDPNGKKFCNDCILLFLIKTNNCQRIIDHFYQFYCLSSPVIDTNPCIWYFSRTILSYPLVIKYVLKYTSNIDKLFHILIFYLSKIKIDTLKSMHSEFFNPKEGYKIVHPFIVSIFIFEYNLCAILSLFVTLIPYFKKKHILRFIQLNIPQMLLWFISDSKWSKLKHIQSNIRSFYKKSFKKFKTAWSNDDTQIKWKTPCNTDIYFGIYEGDGINKTFIHRNAVLDALINLYCYLSEKIDCFKTQHQFVNTYNLLNKFTIPRFVDYENHSLEDALRGNIIDGTVTNEYKLWYFVYWAIGTKLYSIKDLKQKNIKLKDCGNDQCKKSKKKCDFKIFKLCKGCRLVLYCSKKCQKIDWQKGGHKLYCQSIIL